MIVDPTGSTAISSLGWVDGDSLWCWNRATRDAHSVPLNTGARWTSVHASETERFAVAHHFGGQRFEITVRSFAAPDAVLAKATITRQTHSLEGDGTAWAGVPRLFVEYLAFEGYQDSVLVNVVAERGRPEIQRLEWYDDGYDKGYEGVVGVLQVPRPDHAIVSVQRSARLIVHDLGNGQCHRAVEVAGRTSAEAVSFRLDGRELWVHAYNAVVVMEPTEWRELRRAVVQPPIDGMNQFAGRLAFAPDDGLCVVARPFSGDVIGLDPVTLKADWTAQTGSQPLEVAALGGGEIVARDWKTGATLVGALKRR